MFKRPTMRECIAFALIKDFIEMWINKTCCLVKFLVFFVCGKLIV